MPHPRAVLPLVLITLAACTDTTVSGALSAAKPGGYWLTSRPSWGVTWAEKPGANIVKAAAGRSA